MRRHRFRRLIIQIGFTPPIEFGCCVAQLFAFGVLFVRECFDDYIMYWIFNQFQTGVG